MKTQSILVLLFICIVTNVPFADATKKKEGKKLFSWRNEVEMLKRADLLPAYRTGCLVEQVSSYDTTGGNNDGFSGQYSFVRKEGNNLVLADLEGPGVINRIWTPTPTKDTLSFYFDGEKKPRLVICFNDLFSGKVYPFLKPICGNEAGGFYCYLPIPYQKSCKIVFGGEKIMFHQIQYRNLPGFDVETYGEKLVAGSENLLKEVAKVWDDITPEVGNFAIGKSCDYKCVEKTFIIQPGEKFTFFDMDMPGRIIGMEIDGGQGFDGLYKDILLQACWDDEAEYAIHAPVADFFGYAYGKSAMRSLLIGKAQTVNYCYLPFPFDKKACVSLSYIKRNGEIKQFPVQVSTKVYYSLTGRVEKSEGKFYSSWRREINPEIGKYYQFVDLKGKGHYVGTVHQAQGLNPGMTLFFEGDDSTYVDGKMRLHGTGSEDYYNGGWYALLDRWDRGMSLPLHGALSYSLPMSGTGGYRFKMTDKMPYEKELYIGIEHGPEDNAFPVDYTSVAYYYSDSPSAQNMEATEELRTVYVPDEHVYFPQLMEITLGGGLQVSHDRGLRMKADNQGMVRISLTDVPEGRYEVYLSYFVKPEGADFSVWQRQKKLSDWVSTKNTGKEELKEKVSIGEIELTMQTNSLSFHIRVNGEGKEFELDRIFLRRIK